MSTWKPRVALRTLTVAAAFATACTKPPSAEHASSAPNEPMDEPADNAGTPGAEDPAAEDLSANESATPSGAADTAAPSGPPLSTLCKTTCGAQSSECKPDQVKECQRNYCDRYGKAEKVCEPSVRAALECAKAQPNFLLCAAVVPDSCSQRFRETEACLATGVAPVAKEDGPELPAGFARYEARAAGFSVAMPKGVQEKSEGGVRSWSAESEGVRYEVRREPLPEEKKFDQRAFLRIASKLLGKCAPKMKLYSFVETEDRTIIQFETRCPDNTQHRGAFYVHGKNYFVLQATSGGQPIPHGDTFAYSFEPR